MKKYNLKEMKKGWFVGNFSPSLHLTESCEVGVKKYKKGDKESEHFHMQAKEITVVISGKIKMKNQVLNENDIIVIEPNESTDFEALEDTVTAVFKSRSVAGDKYLK